MPWVGVLPFIPVSEARRRQLDPWNAGLALWGWMWCCVIVFLFWETIRGRQPSQLRKAGWEAAGRAASGDLIWKTKPYKGRYSMRGAGKERTRRRQAWYSYSINWRSREILSLRTDTDSPRFLVAIFRLTLIARATERILLPSAITLWRIT